MYNGFRLKLYIILLIILLVLSYLVANLVFGENASQKPFVSLERAFYYQPNIPYIPEYQVLGTMVSETIYNIVRCESGFDPTAKNPKSTAYGLCQFLDSTWEYVQKKWDMELDRNNPNDQLYACKRLLEEEGLSHWEESYSCLINYERD